MMIINQTDTLNEQMELENLNLLQNYSVLLNKLEQLALDVNKELETLSNVDLMSSNDINTSGPGSTGSHISFSHGLEEIEYTRVVSDIWVGIILTLLIVCVIILICVGFIYHKFQQWKLSSDRSNRNREAVEICRNYTTNYEVESLPSYTIVSGLPTYDDALEEFRKAGIILTPQIPIIKIFEAKDAIIKDLYNKENENTCTCATTTPTISARLSPPSSPVLSPNTTRKLIELPPIKLAQLSDACLSVHTAFGSQRQRVSRSCHDIRNNLLRSRALTYNASPSTSTSPSSSPLSLAAAAAAATITTTTTTTTTLATPIVNSGFVTRRCQRPHSSASFCIS